MDDLIIPANGEDEAVKRLQTVLERSRDYGLGINEDEAVKRLQTVLERSRDYGLEINMKKCRFLQKRVKFLGHVIENGRIEPSDAKTKAVLRFPELKTAFETLKSLLADKPVLQIYRQGADTEVHTDASQEGYGAVLMQKSREDNRFHPVYYMSKKTTPAERKYCSYELEVLAIVEALKKFRIYLLGHNFKIITDCNAFHWL
ncbi:RNase H-like domain found in reverse transcriptase [Popillia japonica]|uniref:RNase H-like domain found in reverse transcriptase n=1 Tax=Popillia japonica TaxID=7064 RepID=A0AAW1IXV7_POPJA